MNHMFLSNSLRRILRVVCDLWVIASRQSPTRGDTACKNVPPAPFCFANPTSYARRHNPKSAKRRPHFRNQSKKDTFWCPLLCDKRDKRSKIEVKANKRSRTFPFDFCSIKFNLKGEILGKRIKILQVYLQKVMVVLFNQSIC